MVHLTGSRESKLAISMVRSKEVNLIVVVTFIKKAAEVFWSAMGDPERRMQFAGTSDLKIFHYESFMFVTIRRAVLTGLKIK